MQRRYHFSLDYQKVRGVIRLLLDHTSSKQSLYLNDVLLGLDLTILATQTHVDKKLDHVFIFY